MRAYVPHLYCFKNIKRQLVQLRKKNKNKKRSQFSLLRVSCRVCFLRLLMNTLQLILQHISSVKCLGNLLSKDFKKLCVGFVTLLLAPFVTFCQCASKNIALADNRAVWWRTVPGSLNQMQTAGQYMMGFYFTKSSFR